jgi:hypothetical protein
MCLPALEQAGQDTSLQTPMNSPENGDVPPLRISLSVVPHNRYLLGLNLTSSRPLREFTLVSPNVT